MSPYSQIQWLFGTLESSLFTLCNTGYQIPSNQCHIHVLPRNATRFEAPEAPLLFALPLHLERALSKAGMRVWASQKEKTSLGPVMSSYSHGQQSHIK